VAEDHYQTLGLTPGAGADEVRAAYLRRMREHHPDLRPGDPDAARTALAVNAAYAVLGDPGRRRTYDASRSTAGPSAPARVTAPEPPRPRAYSEQRVATRQAVSATVLRLAAAALVLGLVLLFTLSGS
jgi:curved DNA-binding protein CbpA